MTDPTTKHFALLAALAELLPVPLLDTIAQNHLRRAAVSRVAHHHGVVLSTDELRTRCDEPLALSWRTLRGVLLWPIKKLLSTVFVVFAVARMWRAASSVMTTAETLAADLAGPAPRVAGEGAARV